MTDEELRTRMKAYILGWKEVGEFLEAERREQVRTAETRRSLEILSGMFDHAVRSQPPRQESGLFEQQRLLTPAVVS